MKEEKKLGNDTLLGNLIVLVLVEVLSYIMVCILRGGHDPDYIAWLCFALAIRLVGMLGRYPEHVTALFWPWLVICLAVIAQAWREGKQESKPRPAYQILQRRNLRG